MWDGKTFHRKRAKSVDSFIPVSATLIMGMGDLGKSKLDLKKYRQKTKKFLAFFSLS